MPVNKKTYAIKIPNDNHIAYWDEDRFEANSDDLYKDYPEAEVTSFYKVDPNSIEDDGEYDIVIPNEEHVAKWDAARLKANKDDLLKDYPNAQIYRTNDVTAQRNRDFAHQYEYAQDKVEDANLPESEKQQYSDFVLQHAGRYDKIREQYGRENQPPIPDVPEIQPIRNPFRAGWQATKRMGGEIVNAVSEFGGTVVKNLFGPYAADSQLNKDALEEFERRLADGKNPFEAGEKLADQNPFSMSRKDSREFSRKMKVEALLARLGAENGYDSTAVLNALRDGAKDKAPWEKLNETADKIIAENNAPTEGLGGRIGNMLPMVATTAAGIGLSAVTKNPAYAEALGKATFAGFAASSAGGAMEQAREAGATDEETLAAGIASGAIMYVMGQIPFNRYTNHVFNSVSRDASKKVTELLNNPGTRASVESEIRSLLEKASGEMGFKLASKHYVQDFLGHVLSSTGTFAAMSGMEALVPLIYESPKDYPVLSNVLHSSLDGAVDGLMMGTFFGGITTGIDYHQRHQRWRNQGFLWVGEADFNGNNPDILVRNGKNWETANLSPDEMGRKTVEVVGIKPEDNPAIPVSQSQGGAGAKPKAYYVLADGKLYQIPADALGNNVFVQAPEASKQAAEWQFEARIEAGENARTPEEQSALRQEKMYADRKAENENANGGEVSEATRFDLNNADGAMQGRRNAVRSELEQRIGKPFWRHETVSIPVPEGEAPIESETDMVDVLTYSDGHEVFLVAVDEQGNYATIDSEGNAGFMSKEEVYSALQNGGVMRSYEPMESYLNEKVQAQDKLAEQERMAVEQADNLTAVQQRVQQEGRLNLGTPEAEAWGTVVDMNPAIDGGVVVQVEGEEQPRVVTWQKVADAFGMPLTPKTDAEIVDERIDVDKTVERYNKIPQGAKLQVPMGENGTDVTEYQFRNAELVDGDIIIKAIDPESSNIVDLAPEMVSNLEELVSPKEEAKDVEGNTVPAASEPSEPALVFDDPIANELGIPQEYAFTTKKGRVVVDGQKLWTNNPQLWAQWNDNNPERVMSTKDYLAEKLKQADSEVAKARTNLEMELKGRQDPERMEDLREILNAKASRQQEIADLYNGYDAAEKAAKEAEEAARKAEIERKQKETEKRRQSAEEQLGESGVTIVDDLDSIDKSNLTPSTVYATVSVAEDGTITIKFRRASVNSKGEPILGSQSGLLVTSIKPEDIFGADYDSESAEGIDFGIVELTSLTITPEGQSVAKVKLRDTDGKSTGAAWDTQVLNENPLEHVADEQLTEREQEIIWQKNPVLDEPTTLEGLAATMLGRNNYNHKISRESFEKEIGKTGSGQDYDKFNFWFAPKGKGLSIDDLADALIELDNDYGFIPMDRSGADQKDAHYAKQAIISVIGSAQSPRDLTDYVRKENERRLKEEEDYYRNAPDIKEEEPIGILPGEDLPEGDMPEGDMPEGLDFPAGESDPLDSIFSMLGTTREKAALDYLDRRLADIDRRMRENPEQREELLDEKAAAIQEYVESEKTDKDGKIITSTLAKLTDAMEGDGLSSDFVANIMPIIQNAIKEGIRARSFRAPGGRIFMIADQLLNAEDVSTALPHEEEHNITAAKGDHYALASISDRNNLLGAIDGWVGYIPNYHNLSDAGVANEFISHAVERTKDLDDKQIAKTLADAGIYDDKIVNFVKNRVHERRNRKRQLLSENRGGGRTDSFRRIRSEGDLGEDGRNQQTRSGRDLDGQGLRPGEEGEGGTGSGEGEISPSLEKRKKRRSSSVRLTSEEAGSLRHYVNEHNSLFKQGVPLDAIENGNYLYIFENPAYTGEAAYSTGEIRVLNRIPLDADREVIDALKNSIKNGTVRDTRDITQHIKALRSARGLHPRSDASAKGQRRGDAGDADLDRRPQSGTEKDESGRSLPDNGGGSHPSLVRENRLKDISKKERTRLQDKDRNGKNSPEVIDNIDFDTPEGTAFFSLDKDRKSLVGIHNISADKLTKALRMGGLANPSAAVIDIDRQNHFGYGDISLVMPSSLVDKSSGRNIGTYDRDAWTPTYPTVKYFESKQSRQRLSELLKDLPQDLRYTLSYKVEDYLNGDVYNSGLEYLFLKEKGMDIGMQKTPRKYPDASEEEFMTDFLKAPGLSWNGTPGSEIMDAYRALSSEDRLSANLYMNQHGNAKGIQLIKERIEKWPQLKERYEKERSFAEVDSFLYGLVVDARDAGKESTGLTIEKAVQTIKDNGLQEEFGVWQDRVIADLGYDEKIFNGFTPSGTRRYMANTLENVSKWMKKQGRNASSDHGLVMTSGTIMAKMAQKFSSLTQIRRAKKRLVPAGEEGDAYQAKIDDVKERIKNLVVSFWSDKISRESGMLTGELVALDYVQDFLIKGMDLDRVVENYNNTEHEHVSFSEEEKAGFNTLREDIRNLPVHYFETKFERPVYLEEFKAAVVPKDTPYELKMNLRRNGLNLFEYDPESEGDRRRAMLEASEDEEVRFSFIGEAGAARLDAAEEREDRINGLTIARSMEARNEDARKIKLATGWEKGVDGLWRYEMHDFTQFDPEGNIEFKKRNPGLARYQELLQRQNMNLFYPESSQPLTSEENAELEELKSIWARNPRDWDGSTWRTRYHNSSKLPDYIEDEQLFNAYPKFRDTRIVFKDLSGQNAGGYADTNKNEIVVNTEDRNTRKMPFVLVHEIQHLIQDEEGFSQGTSLKAAGERAKTMVANPLDKNQQEFVNSVQLWANNSESWKQAVPLDSYLGQVASRIGEDYYKENLAGKSNDEIRREYNRLVLLKNKASRGLSAIEVYRRTSGEVEARNVEIRKQIGFTDKGMRLTLAEDTEDVARKDQILNMPVKWLLDVDGLTESLYYAQEKANKVPGAELPTAEMLDEVDAGEELMFSLSRNNRNTIEGWLNKREDLDENAKEAVLGYIEEQDNPRLQLATGRWFAQGTIRLPEDMPKVEQAVDVARKAKVDPLQYDSPMALLDAHADFKPTEKRVNPDKVSTLHKVKELPNDVAIYDVEDSDESRQNMRQIINTHFGKDASPWCLLQGDGEGNLTEESANYWEHYNGYPKQVAFQNGKLLAFSANDSSNVRWWDRQDNPSEGIPITMKMPNDPLGRTASYSMDEDGTLSDPYDIHKGNRENGVYESWHDNGVLSFRQTYKNGTGVGTTERWYDNGQLRSISNRNEEGERDGLEETYDRNGQLLFRGVWKNGFRFGEWQSWWENGNRRAVGTYNEHGLEEGEHNEWYVNGNLRKTGSYVNGRQNGEFRMYWENGQPLERSMYSNGVLNGGRESWYKNGLQRTKENFKDNHPDGEQLSWNENGVLVKRRNMKDGSMVGKQEAWYDNGNISYVANYNEQGRRDGVKESYSYDGNLADKIVYHDGDLIEETSYYPGNIKKRYIKYNTYGNWDIVEHYDEKGRIRRRAVQNGVAKDWDDFGVLTSMRLIENGNTVRDLLKENVSEEDADNFNFSFVTDEQELNFLEKEPTVTLYRAMAQIDGKLYPPMSTKEPNGPGEKGKKLKLRQPSEIGKWERSDEAPDKAKKGKDGKWYFDLKKGNGGDVNGVLYNPYFHTSASPLNDQFSGAYNYPELVTVEVQVPISEFQPEGMAYKAEKANDSVGPKDWHSGTVTGQIGEGRQVVLTRWVKPVRVIPDREVAAMIAPKLKDKQIRVPYNVVTPSLRSELLKQGVDIIQEGEEETAFSFVNTNQEMFISNAEKAVEGIQMGKASAEQWLKTLEKNGGLKAGEDKWIGLSDWLKEQKGSVTKQDVLDYINQHKIRIEEVRYAEDVDMASEAERDVQESIGRGKSLEELQAEIDEIAESGARYDAIGEGDEELDSYLIDAMKEEYGDDFEIGYRIEDGEINYNIDEFSIDEEEFNASTSGTKKSNSTRLYYTTAGLNNKREIALTVPTVEPYNASDNIHFGDAGEGRAIAWARFGEATDGEGDRVLVIDEIQSKRHQDARENGYRDNEPLKKAKVRQEEALAAYDKFTEDMYAKYGYAEYRAKMSEEENKEYHRLYKEMQDANRIVSDNGFDVMADEKYVELRKKWEDEYDKAVKERAELQPRISEIYKRLYDSDASEEEKEQLRYEKAQLSNREDEISSAERIAERLMNSRRYVLQREFDKAYNRGVPSAPFEKNWHELAMKRMLRLAAEEGYDYVAWTTGEQQAERYNIGSIVNSIRAYADPFSKEKIYAIDTKSTTLPYPDIRLTLNEDGTIATSNNDEFKGKPLSAVVGKDLAKRMMSLEEGEEISGEGLRIGAEGMSGFYDQILPRFMDKYGKKWGVKTEDISLPDVYDEVGHPLVMHSVKVTPEMKESVMEGQLMFSMVDNEAEKKKSETLTSVNNRLEEMSRIEQIPSSISNTGNQGENIPTDEGGRGGVESFAKIDKKIFSNKSLLPKVSDFITKLDSSEDITADNFGKEFSTAMGQMSRDEHSHYVRFAMPDGESIYIRLSDHSAHARNSIGKKNADKKYSVVLTVDSSPAISFRPSNKVEMTEYVYDHPDKARLINIAKSLFNVIDTGNYVDLADADAINHSPREKNNSIREKAERADAIRAVEDNGVEGFSMVVGEDNVKGLYDSIYRAIPKEILKPILDRAMADGLNIRRSLDNYLHELAKNGTEKDDTGLLRALYSEIRGLTGNPALTDNDIRYMLWKATGETREGDILSLAEDIATRKRWGVGEDELSFSMVDEFSEETQEDRENYEKAMRDAAAERAEARKSLKSELNPITKAMSAQKVYDKATVDGIVKFAKKILKNGRADSFTLRETNRLLTLVAGANGKSATFATRYADQLTDLLLDHIVKDEAKKFQTLVNVKDTATKESGVETLGKLDVIGQATIKAFRDNKDLSIKEIEDKLAEVDDRMDDPSDAVRSRAYAEHEGLMLARDYQTELSENIKEGNALESELDYEKEAKKTGNIDRKTYEEFVRSTKEAIRENKMERVDLYREFGQRLSEIISGGTSRAKAFREADKQRIEDIHHDANRDMQGVQTNEHRKDSRIGNMINSDPIRFATKPFATFDQMLRLFGNKNITGEGYLWNRYMRQWVDSAEKSYDGFFKATEELDKKVSEVFGKDMIWSDLYGVERKMPTATVRFFDGGEMRDHELTAGNLLYIYMVNKMTDGKMKLRKMGISEDDVKAIQRNLDPRFIELADWVQDEFLVKKRNDYNAVHERMFGAPMAAIEDYFPIKILANARVEEVDLGSKPGGSTLSSTTTGSIIKRRKNSLALDLLHTDAFSLVIEHLQQMEDWAAFAEMRRDVNTLLSYKHFRNQMQNMNTIYGSGDVLWKNFMDVASIATGSYQPKVGKGDLDTVAVNVAKGVTAAKIAFRVNTAIKQILSAPAYLSDARMDDLVKALVTPSKSWKWCMENLPVFHKRWSSRLAGDTRLLDTDSDWKIWKDNAVKTAARLGMTPNAFVDATTVAIGAKAMYDTKYRRYVNAGYSPEQADRRAKQDATILYNQTQQSEEGPFISPIQVDRTFLSVLLSTYRNSSMSYQRQFHDAARIAGRLIQNQREERIEFMKRQQIGEGLDEEKARRFSEKEYDRQYWRTLVRFVVFGYGLQLLWDLGSDVWYLLFGKNKKVKEKMLSDAAKKALAGPIEGMAGGNVISDAWGTVSSGGAMKNIGLAELPLESDTKQILQALDYDKPAAINDIINLVAQSGIGVNPQTFTDVVVGIIDACKGDLGTAKEVAMLMMRIGQVPQSTIDEFYLDELEMTAGQARKLSPKQLAERYADYKISKKAPLTETMYDDATYEKRHKSYEKKFEKKVKERKELNKK